MRHFSDTFMLFPMAQELLRELVSSCGEFSHLGQARIPCLLSQRALVERGQAMPGVCMGTDSEARSSAKRQLLDWLVIGFVSPICEWEEPDFVLLFDVALWPGGDTDEDRIAREHLMYHLLCHIEHALDKYGAPKFHDNGTPVLRLRAHDVERFESEILRYGRTVSGIADEHGIYAAARARELDQQRGRS